MRRLFAATLLVSAAAIGYELLLMRMLSIVQWHHFAYMIISLALLGYGASGTSIALFRDRLERNFEAAFATSALAFGIAMVTCFVLGQRVPFNALEIVWDWHQFLNLAVIYFVFFVPFFFAATCIGLAFTCRGKAISRIYFFDLFGAGLGAILIIGVLFVLPPQHALIALMLLPLAAAALVGWKAPARRRLAAVGALWLISLTAIVAQGVLELRISEYKGLSQALAVIDSRIVEETSGPLGYITVVESPTIPFRHAPGLSFTTRHIPPDQLAVFTDGDGMSAITHFDGDIEQVAFLADTTAALPYALLREPEVLVLGAGGGSDVLLALYHGAQHVDAVELDPQMIRLVRETYAELAGELYSDPRVSLFTREARGFVSKSEKRYDLIHIGLLDSFGASGAGVQSLNESYVYTVEALRTYIEHTTPGGIVAITRWLKLPPRDSLKLVATAIEALRSLGIAEPARHFAVMRGWNTSTLLVKNGALEPADVSALREFAQQRSFDMAWFPGIEPQYTNRYNRLDQAYLFEGTTALLGEDTASFFERYKFDIEPATDNRPYFFHFFKWRTLPEIHALREVGGAGLIEWGYLILVATLVQAIVAGLVLVLLPLARTERSWRPGTAPRMGAYFLLLGLAFLFVEMAFIQRFILFLSHPLYAVAIVLAAFLLFAGLGSAASERIARLVESRGWSAVVVAAAAISIVSLLWLALLPSVFATFIGYPDAFRIVLSVLLIAPLAFPMGLPFPLGLAHVAEHAPAFVPWAWGINGFASVVSAVLATLLAIEFGFAAVIVLALVLYAAAAALLTSPPASPARQ